MRTKQLLNAGTATAVIFWLSTIIAGFIHGNYNHLTGTISELGALWAKSHIFMTVATALCGISSLLFMVGLYQACKAVNISTLPVYTIISMPVTFFWVAVFSLGNSLHGATGPVFLLLYIGVILSLFLWRGERLRQTRTLSFISLLILLLIFLRFIPSLQNDYPGLIQRFAHLGWSVWFVSLNICFVKLINSKSALKTNN
jgi:hypothetical protein